MPRSRDIGLLLLLVVLASCTEATGPNLSTLPGYAISDVDVLPSSATVLVTDTITTADRVQFRAVATGKRGTALGDVRFAWSTSDPTIAVIDSVGLVTPVRPGTVDVIASVSKVGKARLEILPATASVSVLPLRDTIFVDEPIVTASDTVRLHATAHDPADSTLTGVAFTWQSSSTAVVTVDANGVVHATGVGTANVTVSANGQSATTQITVLPVVSRIDLTTPASQVLSLDTVQLAAVARNYSNAPMARTFTWTSSNAAIATVNASGRVIFHSTGQVTITARTAFRTSTTTVTALERRLTFLDAGQDFNCGFTTLGRGYCWGRSDDGRTAAGPDSVCYRDLETTGTCILPPKRMNRPELVLTTISAGGNFACGIEASGLIYCWGSDAVGQIGNGLDGAGTTPQLATVRNERFTTVTAGTHHACALNMLGIAYCWGSDSTGQLGDHRQIHSTTPIPVADTTLRFRSISAGARHTCAVTLTGAAYCWGDGSSGQLGNGTTARSEIPIPVPIAQTLVSVTTGDAHTCALDLNGVTWCWGRNAEGQLGIGTTGPIQTLPVQVSGAAGYTMISAGDHHTCGIAATAVRCWGRSESGEVGDGIVTSHNVALPTQVAGLLATLVSAGAQHTCAISVAGESWCWGSNRYGALGNEYQAAVRATPQLVARPR